MIDKIILGTAQFGLDYGINNHVGRIPKKEVFKMLDFCLDNGITRIDTAGVYGNSEKLIGEYLNHNKGVNFEITTKIKKDSNSLIDNIEIRLSNLNVEFIEELLFHSLDDYQYYKNQKNVLHSLVKFFQIWSICVHYFGPNCYEIFNKFILIVILSVYLRI